MTTTTTARMVIGMPAGMLVALTGLGQVRAQEMPKSLAEATAMEQADRLPITDFYSTPKNLAATKPGDLLRKESFAGYALPAGATAVRILYHSLDATGQGVATSGVVLVPGGTPPPHDPAMENSTPDQLEWIRSRFAGKPATSNCPT